MAAAAAVLAQLTGLGVRVVTKGCFDAPHGEYDAQSGTLVLYLPFCQDGGRGGSFLSDALDGGRVATDGVGASEWALAQVNTKVEGTLFNSVLPGLCHPFAGRLGGPDNKHPIDRRTGQPDLRYALCDGGTYIAPDKTKVDTPDLRDRFVLGAGMKYDSGGRGGNAVLTGTTGETALTTDQMPAHSHSLHGYGLSVAINGGSKLSGIQMDAGNNKEITNSTGGGQSHSHDLSRVAVMPPYYALAYIMAL